MTLTQYSIGASLDLRDKMSNRADIAQSQTPQSSHILDTFAHSDQADQSRLSSPTPSESVLVLDFGSQNSRLIARRVRESKGLL